MRWVVIPVQDGDRDPEKASDDRHGRNLPQVRHDRLTQCSAARPYNDAIGERSELAPLLDQPVGSSDSSGGRYGVHLHSESHGSDG